MKENEKLKQLNAELNELYMEQDDLYSAYAAHFGLSDTAFWILYAICDDDTPQTQTELARLFHLPPQSLNSATAGLTFRGLLRLEQRPGVRSGKALRLTDAGKAFCDRVILPFFALEEQALGTLGEDMARYVEFARRETVALRAAIAKAIEKTADTTETLEPIMKENP